MARTNKSIVRNFDSAGRGETVRRVTLGLSGLSGANFATTSSIDQRIAMVIELMISSPTRAISVESVALLLSLSPSRLRHLFKEQVGIPIHKYEVMLRLERVRLLLRTTDCSVKETARMLGFIDMSNFTHMFKRAYGTTPGAVRSAGKKGTDSAIS